MALFFLTYQALAVSKFETWLSCTLRSLSVFPEKKPSRPFSVKIQNYHLRVGYNYECNVALIQQAGK